MKKQQHAPHGAVQAAVLTYLRGAGEKGATTQELLQAGVRGGAKNNKSVYEALRTIRKRYANNLEYGSDGTYRLIVFTDVSDGGLGDLVAHNEKQQAMGYYGDQERHATPHRPGTCLICDQMACEAGHDISSDAQEWLHKHLRSTLAGDGTGDKTRLAEPTPGDDLALAQRLVPILSLPQARYDRIFYLAGLLKEGRVVVPGAPR